MHSLLAGTPADESSLTERRPLLCPRRSMRRSTSEPAATRVRTRPALPLVGRVLPPASDYGHLTRSRPQDSAPNTPAPQWEPRKPLAGIHAAMRADEMLKRVVKAVQKALRE